MEGFLKENRHLPCSPPVDVGSYYTYFSTSMVALSNRGCYSYFWLISTMHKNCMKFAVLANYGKAN